MTRHRILNPKTGRMVFKTGVIGQKIKNSKPEKRKRAKKIAKAKKWKCNGGVCRLVECASKKKKKHGGASKTIKYDQVAGKTKGYASRPSARAMLDCGDTRDVFYAGKWHYMHLDKHDRPSYKAY
jgi:hypothetical protein